MFRIPAMELMAADRSESLVVSWKSSGIVFRTTAEEAPATATSERRQQRRIRTGLLQCGRPR
uniref:Uncharacterized protein n=1 Tax=Macrostomum lignano TaxID=282301 RepID=A0A1I8GIT4_9PLAT